MIARLLRCGHFSDLLVERLEHFGAYLSGKALVSGKFRATSGCNP